MFDTDLALEKIQHGFKIPAQPYILEEIDGLIDSEAFDLPDLADLIAKDMCISSDVLCVVNSETDGFNRTIADINQAVCFLGAEKVKAIVAVNKLRHAFSDKFCIKLEGLWEEAIDTASAMLFINKWLGNKYPPDSLYTFGLFHDCGIAAMGYKYPDYNQVLAAAKDDPDVDLAMLEDQHYNVDHATIGFYICSSWRLPKSICEMIRVHHDFYAISRYLDKEQKGMMSILMIADYLLRHIRNFEESTLFDQRKEQLLSWLDMSDFDFDDLHDDLNDSLNA